MKTLLTLNDSNIDPDSHDFRHREAARAVVLDDQGKVPLLKVHSGRYHKLPGGGIDEGEDVQTALGRELLEEIGCKAEVIAEVGEIIEYRNWEKLMQTSYCFYAKQVGESKKPSFTESELAAGFEILWTKNIDEAIELLDQDRPQNTEGTYIQKRDLQFLKSAKQLI